MQLALITQGPKERTLAASFALLNHECVSYATTDIIISVLTVAFLMIANVVYQKKVLKTVNEKQLFIIAVLDLLGLLIASVAAIYHYYLGMSYEIYLYQNYIHGK